MPITDLPTLYCPMGCGNTLHVMSSGAIRCLLPKCPDPNAVVKILSQPESHLDVVEFTGDDFRILHPLRERIDGQLFDCPVHLACQVMDGPPRDAAGRPAPGRYRAWLDKDGILTLDLISEEPEVPLYDLPLDDPRHRCAQGLCNDHAGPPPVSGKY